MFEKYLCIVGENGVGKSTLLPMRRQEQEDLSRINNSSPNGTESFLQVSLPRRYRKKSDHFNETYSVNIVELNPNQKELISGHMLLADSLCIVFDLTNQDSFKKVDDWYQQCMENIHADKRPYVLLIGTKADQKNKRQVSTKEIKQKAKILNADYIETSSNLNRIASIRKAFYKAVSNSQSHNPYMQALFKYSKLKEKWERREGAVDLLRPDYSLSRRICFWGLNKGKKEISSAFKRMKKDAMGTFKAYRSDYDFQKDLRQPYRGIGHIAEAIYLAFLAVCYVPVTLYMLFFGLAFEAHSLQDYMELSARLIESISALAIASVARLTQGLLQFATSPLTYLIKIPLRLYITKHSERKNIKIEKDHGIPKLAEQSHNYIQELLEINETHEKQLKDHGNEIQAKIDSLKLTDQTNFDKIIPLSLYKDSLFSEYPGDFDRKNSSQTRIPNAVLRETCETIHNKFKRSVRRKESTDIDTQTEKRLYKAATHFKSTHLEQEQYLELFYKPSSP